MGAIIKMLVQGFLVGAPAAVGYMFNDIAGWFANLTGTSDKVVSSDGTGFKPWYVVVVAILAGAAILFITKMFSGRKKLFTILLLAGAYVIDYFLFGGVPVNAVTAGLLVSIDASTTQTKTIPFCPEYITFNASTVPTDFQISVIGDGLIFGLNGSGLTNLNGIRFVGELTANQYVYQIADGFIRKNTTFKIANAVAGQLDIYGFSDSPGKIVVTHNSAYANANASLEISDFVYASFPSMAAADTATITWADNTTDELTRIELMAYLGYNQEVTATRYNLDNYSRKIRKIQFRGAAAQEVFYLRAQRAKGAVNQSL